MADDYIMEMRTEVMVSPTAANGDGHRTAAHFLKPTVTSTTGAAAAPCLSADGAAKFSDLPLKVKFIGWSRKLKTWKTWVNQMSSSHRSTWELAGIHDAIMNSTTAIHRHDDLMFEFVEKWSPPTNTFAFPWGEATVTLEDTAVLGGYAVLGESVTAPPEDETTREIVKKLLRSRSKLSRTKSRNPRQGLWIAKFMGSGSEIEHEAFLAYWLSRFVFPSNRRNIGEKNLLSIATRLARGVKIALAPAVLAAIYKSLSLLKAAVIAARKSRGIEANNNVAVEITVSAPLPLVQVWIWERFPSLRPNPKSINPNDPRLARWSDLKKLGIRDLPFMINSAGEEFQWRPYPRGKLYNDCGYWAILDSDCGEDLEMFVRCLRPSELVGMEPDCIEQYLPHRVGMQFGMDQGIPGYVARVNVNSQLAWNDYTRPIRDREVYVPPRDYNPKCTARYLIWWTKLYQGYCGVKNTSKVPKVETNVFPGIKLEADHLPPPPGFPPKRKQGESNLICQVVKKLDNDLPSPPGFPTKRRPGETNLIGQQIVQKQCPLSSSPIAKPGVCGMNSTPRKSSKRKFPESPSRKILEIFTPVSSPKQDRKKGKHSSNEIGEGSEQGKDKLSSTADNENVIFEGMIGDEGEEKDREAKEASTSELLGLEQLEERVRKLEKLCAWLKS